MRNYIDSHSHLNFPEYEADRPEVLKRMRTAGVATITVGVDLASSRSAVALAEKEPDVFAAVGLHPHDNLKELSVDFDHQAYLELAKHPRVVAIGECGLDYSRLDPTMAGDKLLIIRQKKVFHEQIDIANHAGKPLMLHVRPSKDSLDAYEDAYEILHNEIKNGKFAGHAPKSLGDVHFFAGDWSIAQKFIGLGFTLSFTGVITFARDYDEVIRNTPLDMILSETDAPFVSPIPHRGKRNEPSHVPLVVGKIAEIRGAVTAEECEKVRVALVQNAKRVFGL